PQSSRLLNSCMHAILVNKKVGSSAMNRDAIVDGWFLLLSIAVPVSIAATASYIFHSLDFTCSLDFGLSGVGRRNGAGSKKPSLSFGLSASCRQSAAWTRGSAASVWARISTF